jgi:hypothetical protein
MSERKNLPEMLNLFNTMFSEEKPTLDALINYEVLVLTIETALAETPNDSILGGKIRGIISDWKNKNQGIYKAPKKQKVKYPKFELLNSEGPIMVLKKIGDKFHIYDEWKQLIAVLTRPSLMAFIEGKVTMTDTRSRVWNYLETSSGMKRSETELMDFINQ